MLKQGDHPKIVSERLGLASIVTFSHVLPGIQEAAALKFEEGIPDAAMEEQSLQVS